MSPEKIIELRDQLLRAITDLLITHPEHNSSYNRAIIDAVLVAQKRLDSLYASALNENYAETNAEYQTYKEQIRALEKEVMEQRDLRYAWENQAASSARYAKTLEDKLKSVLDAQARFDEARVKLRAALDEWDNDGRRTEP